MAETILMIAIVVLVTLVGSFTCSIFEAALYTIPSARIDALIQKGVHGARRLQALRAAVDEPISAILTLNTITHTVGSALAGGLVFHTFGDQAFAIFTALFTLAMLLFTEIVPKTMGVRYATMLAPRFAFSIQVLIWVQWPLVKLAKGVTRLLGGGSHLPRPSEQEVISVAAQSQRAGEISLQEARWVRNVLYLNDVQAHQIMTPREHVEAIAVDKPLSELCDESIKWRHSRLLVHAQKNPDEILGVVLRRQVYDALARDHFDETISHLMSPSHNVNRNAPANELIDQFVARREHLFCVINTKNEYIGIVTLEDVLEEMLGQEIEDEFD
jgi:CBS domain containing-hemolysin-like protein